MRSLLWAHCPGLGCLALWRWPWRLAVGQAREVLLCSRCAQNPLTVSVAAPWLSSWESSRPPCCKAQRQGFGMTWAVVWT